MVDEIPFETRTYENANIAAGEEIVYVEGKPGQVIEIYEVTEYTNSTRNKAFVTTEETQPENRVVTIGTKE